MSKRSKLALVLMLVLAAVILIAWYKHRSHANNASGGKQQPSSTAAHSQCKSINGLPDPYCTPGKTNPDVTQENIYSNICVPHWTEQVRPPSSYTNALKARMMKEYGIASEPLENYEQDHLIPLSLGGSPKDPGNEWPQPWDGPYNAHLKDHAERYLQLQVCAGKITLAEAQRLIATNWVAVYESLPKKRSRKEKSPER